MINKITVDNKIKEKYFDICLKKMLDSLEIKVKTDGSVSVKMNFKYGWDWCDTSSIYVMYEGLKYYADGNDCYDSETVYFYTFSSDYEYDENGNEIKIDKPNGLYFDDTLIANIDDKVIKQDMYIKFDANNLNKMNEFVREFGQIRFYEEFWYLVDKNDKNKKVKINKSRFDDIRDYYLVIRDSKLIFIKKNSYSDVDIVF